MFILMEALLIRFSWMLRSLAGGNIVCQKKLGGYKKGQGGVKKVNGRGDGGHGRRLNRSLVRVIIGVAGEGGGRWMVQLFQ